MLYSFELQMAGVILLTAMGAGGISLWIKKRRAQKELDEAENDDAQNDEAQNDDAQNDDAQNY